MTEHLLGLRGDDYVLSVDQIEQFRRDGYVTLRNVLTGEELATIEPSFQRFIRGEVSGMGRDFCDMSGPYDRRFEDFSLVNAVLPRKYRPELQGNIFERRAASISRQLIGDSATLDYDQFLAKRPAKPDAIFTWHQDLGLDFERSIGFTHSHNDAVNWETPLGALTAQAPAMGMT
jgi:hypothetical protein